MLSSIGYRGRPVAGLPFDDDAGVVPNRGGRVVDPADRFAGTRLVRGWLDQKGPNGFHRHQQVVRSGNRQRARRRLQRRPARRSGGGTARAGSTGSSAGSPTSSTARAGGRSTAPRSTAARADGRPRDKFTSVRGDARRSHNGREPERRTGGASPLARHELEESRLHERGVDEVLHGPGTERILRDRLGTRRFRVCPSAPTIGSPDPEGARPGRLPRRRRIGRSSGRAA